MNTFSSLLRLISRLACLIVLVSFALFVVDQAGSASDEQQAQVNAAAPPSSAASTTPRKPAASDKNGVRRTIDDAADAITSPFSGAVAGSTNAWVVHGGRTLLALIVYGFGLGYLARVLRVRV
ncbi:MAG TPA: hypothetical protein VID29_11070 [Solirubrobacteraceae bacterium]|jgi:hypothetical protein